MRLRCLPRLTLLLLLPTFLCATSSRVSAADLNPAEPYAFLSARPTLDSSGPPAEEVKLASVTLRPNTDQQAYAFVYNPKDRAVAVKVTLAQAGLDKNRNVTVQAGGELARTAQPIVVPPKAVVRVPLVGKAVPAPAPAPAATTADKAPAPPAGIVLPQLASIVLRVEEAAAGQDPLAPNAKPSVPNDNSYSVDVFPPTSPSIGVRVTQRSEQKNSLTVQVTFPENKNLLTDKPVKVSLDLRSDLNPGLDISKAKGTYEAELAPGQSATLFVEGVILDPVKNGRRNALIAVNVDGYDRAEMIETGFEQAADRATRQPNFRLAFNKGTPGKPCKVTVEADGINNIDERNPVLLQIDRVGRGDPKETLMKYTSERKKEIAINVSNDSIVFNTVLTDWTLDFATTRVIGLRSFQISAKDKKSAVANLLLDATPPVSVAIADIPAKSLITGKVITLSGTGRDPESDIESVLFFTGDTPGADGKPAAGGKVIPGTAVASKTDDKKFEASLRLPDIKGEMKVGVVFINKVGLRTATDITVYVREPDADKAGKKTGSIEGVVVQGYRMQPGLPVELKDAGKVVKSTVTDSTGKFKFEDLAPGAYTVSSVKRADALAKGQSNVTVVAGDKPAKVEINVLR